MNMGQGQDWDTVVLRKSKPKAGTVNKDKVVNEALRTGGEVGARSTDRPLPAPRSSWDRSQCGSSIASFYVAYGVCIGYESHVVTDTTPVEDTADMNVVYLV